MQSYRGINAKSPRATNVAKAHILVRPDQVPEGGCMKGF